MGKIPFPDNISPNAIRGDRLATGNPNLDAPGQALQGLGRAIASLGGKWQRTAQSVKKYNSKLAIEKWNTAQAESYERDKATAKPDGSDWVQNRATFLNKSFQDVRAATSDDPQGREDAEAFFRSTFETTMGKAMADSIAMGQTYVTGTTSESVGKLLAGNAFQSVEQYNDHFENAVKPRLDGVFTEPVQREEAHGAIAVQMRADYIRRFPQAAMPVPREDGTGFDPPPMPQGGIFEGMAPDEWQATTTAAVKADKERRKAEAAERERKATELVSSGYDLLSSEQMTTDWIEGNRDTLSPAQYRTFNAALRRKGQDVKTDPQAFTTLASRAVREDVQDEAFLAYSEGRLSKPDMARIMGLSRQTLSDEAERPWLIEARKSLAERLAPVETEDYAQHAKRLEGVFALNDWASANPKATRDDVKKKANEIATDYNTSVVGNLRASLDLPKFAGGSRFTMSEESLSASAMELANAYRAGKVNVDELTKQTGLLRRWKTVLDEEARLGTSRL